jgi:diketogulonate reductase-like aldo/keto reductase
MEFKELVEGVRISVLGLGTWGMGGSRTPDSTRDVEEVLALRTGIELGVAHIDTAEMYGGGHTEELVGEAIRPYEREKLFITTKVWTTNLRCKDLIESIKGSLKRLNVDYIDLYLVHWPNPDVPLKETMRGLEHCVDEGYTRFIGVSNFSASLLEEAQSYLKDNRIVANQVRYSLMEQSIKDELLPYCLDNGVMVVAYRPLERGILTGSGHTVLDELAVKYGRTRSQLALNWLISQKKVVAIPKSSNIEHLKENLGAIGWKLSKDDFKRLGKSFL